MKTTKKVLTAALTAILLSPFASYATEGTAGGGGGNAVLCYTTTQVKQQVFTQIQKNTSPYTYTNLMLDKLEQGFRPQLLDLWEARMLTGFPGAQVKNTVTGISVEELYAKFEPRLKQISTIKLDLSNDGPAASIDDYLVFAKTKPSQWKAEPAAILPINDMSLVAQLPHNCLIAQVAFYDDVNNIVHFDSRIVRLMELEDQNALRVHEDIYRARRVRGSDLQSIINVYGVNGRIYLSNHGLNPYENDVTDVVRRLVRASRNSDAVRALVGHLFTTSNCDETTDVLSKRAFISGLE